MKFTMLVTFYSFHSVSWMILQSSDILSLASLSRLCKIHQSRLLHLYVFQPTRLSPLTQQWCHLVLFIQVSKNIWVSFYLGSHSDTSGIIQVLRLSCFHIHRQVIFSLPPFFTSPTPSLLSRLCSGSFSPGKHSWLASLCITYLTFTCWSTTPPTSPSPLLHGIVIISLLISLLSGLFGSQRWYLV